MSSIICCLSAVMTLTSLHVQWNASKGSVGIHPVATARHGPSPTGPHAPRVLRVYREAVSFFPMAWDF